MSMKSSRLIRGAIALASLSLIAAACGSDDDDSAAPASVPASAEGTTPDTTMPDTSMTGSSTMGSTAMNSAEICDTDELVKAVQGGSAQGTLEGMADDPVATAASNNPVLTTLTAAVTAAGLGDTLNSAEALTVFAPTDCAFAKLDPATLKAALDDPSGLLTTVLGYHVIAGQKLSAADLAKETELETFTGEKLSISDDGGELMVGGQAKVLVPDIQTKNATVFLIDTVMLPPSVTDAATDTTMAPASSAADAMADSTKICDKDAIVAAVQGGAEQGTLEGMADDPVATAASNNPVLTTLTTAVGAAGLVDTLNSADALTVFAPTDCAFAKLDPATLQAALADPSGLLTTVLGYHVIAGERLSAADLATKTELDTFTGEKLPIKVDGDTITVGNQAMVIVGDIQTKNATVFLIDAVMIPPSAG